MFPLAAFIALLPALQASPLPQAVESQPAPISSAGSAAAGSAFSSFVGVTSGQVISPTAVTASATRSGVVGSAASSAASSAPTHPYPRIQWGATVYNDPPGASRIHPYGRGDLCVRVVNETVEAGSVVEVGRCLNNTLPYPGKRNLFELIDGIWVSASSNGTNGTTTSGLATASAPIASGSVASDVPASQLEKRQQTATGVAQSAASRPAIVSGVSAASFSAISSGSRSSAFASASASAAPTPSLYPIEGNIYYGLIAPAGQTDLCLAGPPREDGSQAQPRPSAPGSGPGPEGPVTASVTSSIAGNAKRQAVESAGGSRSQSPAQEATASAAATPITISSSTSRAASRSAAATATGSGASVPRPSSSTAPGGMQDITLQPCNASDPAQNWRLGPDARAPGGAWKLSLFDETRCATILHTQASANNNRLALRLGPCVSSSPYQVIWLQGYTKGTNQSVSDWPVFGNSSSTASESGVITTSASEGASVSSEQSFRPKGTATPTFAGLRQPTRK